MKYTSLTVCIATLLICFTSCKKTLDILPIDSVSTLSYFRDQNDFDQAINGLYSSLRPTNENNNNAAYGGNLYWSVASDEMFFQFSWHTPWFDISSGTLNPNTQDVGTIWESGFRTIFWANTIIEKLEEKRGILAEDFYTNAKGEAHFIRGITYLRLTSLYGAVPLVDRVIASPSEAKLPRTSVEEITNNIILPDLEIAISNLEETPFEGKNGKATRQSAMGMKVRALLYLKDYPATVAAAQALMTLADASPYVGFLPTFEEIFSVANEDNEEVLFALKYVGNGTRQGNSFNTPFGGVLPGVTGVNGGWGASSITPELINSFPMTDGLLPANSPLYDEDDKWSNRGARFEKTFYIANKSLVNGLLFERTMVTSNGGDTYKDDYPLNLNKGFMNEANRIDWMNEGESDFIVLRYTDVLLMYAEAKTELNQIDQSVYNILNMIRERAGIANIPAGLSQTQMRDAIRNERRLELAFEGVRYFDLRRWGIAKEVINAVSSDETYNFGSKKTFSDEHYLWPVPQTAIDANSSLLPNNAGY